MRLASILILAVVAVGCGTFLQNLDAVNDPKDDAKLADCRKAGRDAGPDAHVVYGVYVECTKDAGLR